MAHPSMTLVGSILRNAAHLTSRSALYDPQRGYTYTWHEVAAKVMSGAGGLREQGLSKGNRVLILLPDCADAVLAYYAVHAAGGIAVPVRWPASQEYLTYIDLDCNPEFIIGPSSPFTKSSSHYLAGEDVSKLADAADIVYTSGSSGKPKGALLSHYNIASLALNSNFVHSRADDYELICANWAHTFALGRIRTWPYVGNKLTILDSSKPAEAVEFVRSQRPVRVTGLVMTVPAFEMLARLHDGLLMPLVRLRYIEMAAGRPTGPLQRKLTAMLPYARIVHHYGCTEAPYATYRLIGVDSADEGCVGRAAPCVHIDLDARTGDHRMQGVGEVGITGGMVMLGYWGHGGTRLREPYWNTPEQCTPRTFWTGDIGFKDRDDLLYIVGREDDMIYTGGEKVWPARIEDVLRKHPAIEEVAVVGVADPQGVFGQIVVAFATGTPDLSPSARFEHRLEPHEIPRRWELVESFPRTPAGKIDKKELARGYTGS